MCCSSWQSLVVTESTPAHQSREKSQGLFTTNRFTETLLWCSALGKWERNEEHPESARLMSDSLPWIHPLIQISVMSSNHEHLSPEPYPVWSLSTSPASSSPFLLFILSVLLLVSPWLAPCSHLALSWSITFSVLPNVASLAPYPKPQSLLHHVLLILLPNINVF